jgi:hypothetical protein
MGRGKKTWAVVAFLLLTAGGLISIYQVSFDVWMTAYPFANAGQWRVWLCIRLAQTLVIALLWCILGIWLFRHRRKNPTKA